MKRLKIICALFVIPMVLFFLFYDSGGITKRTQRMLRISDLQVWRNRLLDYEQEKGILPKRLGDINFPDLKIISPHIKDVKDRRDSYYRAMADPNFFEEYAEYQLFVSSNESWFIAEKEIPEIGEERYLINNNGDIFSLKKKKVK